MTQPETELPMLEAASPAETPIADAPRSAPTALVCDFIIPALNESASIQPLFDALELEKRHHAARIRHIVLADNGSTDDTPRLAAARGAVVVHEPQRGYGAACLAAIDRIARQDADSTDNAPPDVVVFLDADLADDPAALPLLLDPIALNQADLVIGSRIRLARPGALNIVQRFGNGLACWMIHRIAGRRYTDLGPFRAVRWRTLQELHMTDRTWGWTVEMQMKAAIMNIPTAEIDVPYRRRRHGRSKISGTIRGVIKAGVRIIFTIFMLWLRRNSIRRQSRPTSAAAIAKI